MNSIEQTLQIYHQSKAVAERIKLEGTDWLKGVSWIDAITGVDLTDEILDRAAWYLKVSDYLDKYGCD